MECIQLLWLPELLNSSTEEYCDPIQDLVRYQSVKLKQMEWALITNCTCNQRNFEKTSNGNTQRRSGNVEEASQYSIANGLLIPRIRTEKCEQSKRTNERCKCNAMVPHRKLYEKEQLQT